MTAPIRLLVVDDHTVVRGGLVALLATVDDMQVIAQASDGEEAFEQYRLHQPDVTLMDLRLGKVGGVEAIQRIRAKWPAARVIVLTTFDGDDYTLDASRFIPALKAVPETGGADGRPGIDSSRTRCAAVNRTWTQQQGDW